VPFANLVLAAFSFVAAALILVIVLRPGVVTVRGGKVLAFLALFVLPGMLTLAGGRAHYEQAKATEFCLSCHVMKPFGQSLLVNDQKFVAAAHYQNRRVPSETACYSCHTEYTMFGGLRSKISGLRHLYLYYFGDPQEAEDIKLRKPYRNRECLHCHAGARSYVTKSYHRRKKRQLLADQISCIECHEPVHALDEELQKAGSWMEDVG
jgi:cytochrome c-type protein NapC